MSNTFVSFKHIVRLRQVQIRDAEAGRAGEELWSQTVAVALEGQVISEEPLMNVCRIDLTMAALDGVDVAGDNWKPAEDMLRSGGE